MNLIMTGIQGSGKGTQSKLVAEKLNLVHISFGDAIYKLLVEDNPIVAPYTLEMYRNGNLATDDVLFRVADHVITPEINKSGFILDGFPRTQGQLEYVMTHFTIYYVVMLDLPESICVERLKTRARPDDTDEGIKTRISNYRTRTEPIFEVFKNTNTLVRVNASKPIDRVYTEILLKIGAID